jgi:hypothetical protein
MKYIKNIIVALSIVFLCVNADCNKVEEKPPINDFFIIEGRLVYSCTDNTPIKNSTFDLVGYNFAERISTTTDSNGYFKFYSKFKDKNLLMRESGGRYILANVPGNKNLNVGEIAYNFTTKVNCRIKNYSKYTNKDTIYFGFISGTLNNKVWGPFDSDLVASYLIKDPLLFIRCIRFIYMISTSSPTINIIDRKFRNIKQHLLKIISNQMKCQQLLKDLQSSFSQSILHKSKLNHYPQFLFL